MATRTAAAAAAAARPVQRNPRVTRQADTRNVDRPAPTRSPDETIQVDGDLSIEDLTAELRHLHGCPGADPDLPPEERRIESYEVDGHKMWGEARVPIVLTIVRCINCGEAVKAER